MNGNEENEREREMLVKRTEDFGMNVVASIEAIPKLKSLMVKARQDHEQHQH